MWHSRLTRGAETDFGDRSTRGVRLSYPNDIWRAHVSYREFGDEYSPPVGFVQRTGFRRLQPSASWNPRPDFLPWLRQANLGVRLEDLWSLEGMLLTRDRSFTLPGLNLESGDEVSVEAQVVRNEVDLPQGEFTTIVYRFIGEWHPSPWLSITQNWQYDDVSQVVGIQGRLRWIVEPGNELYVVYTHNWRNQAGRLDPFAPDLTTLSRNATTKLVYTVTL